MWAARSSIAGTLMWVGLVGFGCNSLIGLDELTIGEHTEDISDECNSNLECAQRLMDAVGDSELVPAVCLKEERRCVRLLTQDCDTLTGDYTDDDAIVIGSLFSTKGSQATTNIARQQSAMLAVEQINRAGGVPAHGAKRPRELVLVSCDEATNPDRASEHLVERLGVPAIVGPNTSSDTLRLSTEFTVPNKTVVMTPTGVASSITALDDDGFTYQMVPSDVQRAPLMIEQINDMESFLKEERELSHVKLAIIYRDDALGIGTRTALNELVLNERPLADSINFGNHVLIDAYDFSRDDQQEIVSKHVEFAPDIVVLAGTAEAITDVLVPLEEQWTAEHRPEYVGIDSVKVPELLAAVSENEGLRRRMRGTGIMPSPESQAVFNAFKVDYEIRYPDSSAGTSGTGPSYDAVYATAFALAATRDEPVTGRSIVKGLKQLSGGETAVPVGATSVLAGFRELGDGRSINAIGTFLPLEWNDAGAPVGATLQMWCIGTVAGEPRYQPSGLTYDIKQGKSLGEYVPCE